MKALILSGGGARGAYQVGVLKYLTEVQGRSWDIIAGISVGALNGSFLAQYQPNEQVQGVKNLELLWNKINGNKSVYKPWFTPLVPSLLGYVASFWTGGLFSTSPLRKLIKRNFNQKNLNYSGVKLIVGAVSMTTGRCKFVTEKTENLIDWIVASSAYPIAFPPVKINGDRWIDGGIRKDVTPLELVLLHNPTEIDIVMTSPIKSEVVSLSKTKSGALGVAIRAVQILNEEGFPFALVESCLQRGISINVYAPDENLKVDLLNFSPEIISKLFNKGYLDADKKHEKP